MPPTPRLRRSGRRRLRRSSSSSALRSRRCGCSGRRWPRGCSADGGALAGACVTGVLEGSQASVAGVPRRRHVARAGWVEVGGVEYDGTNRLWTWSSPMVEDVWGHAQSEEGAKRAFEAWLREWLEKFPPPFQGRPPRNSRNPRRLGGGPEGAASRGPPPPG